MNELVIDTPIDMRDFTVTKLVADVMVQTLNAAGVKRCYGIVGDTLNRIAHAIDRERCCTARAKMSGNW
jgi:hypothetical protein